MGGCASNAQVGASAAAIISKAPFGNYDLVVISAGSNDFFEPRLSHLPGNLKSIRAKVHAGKVVWIRPVNAAAGNAVAATARKHGDGIALVIAGHDHVHPKNYYALASSVLAQQ